MHISTINSYRSKRLFNLLNKKYKHLLLEFELDLNKLHLDTNLIRLYSCSLQCDYLDIFILLFEDERINDCKDINYLFRHILHSSSINIFNHCVDNNFLDKITDYHRIIHLLIGNNRSEIIQLLLSKYNIDPSFDDNIYITQASIGGHTEIVKMLLADSRVDPSARDNYAVTWASNNGHTDIVRMLLADSRVDPTANDNYAIVWASNNGHTEIVRMLLKDPRVDPSAKDNYAIVWASNNGHKEIVRMLLADSRVDPSVNDNYAVKWSLNNKHMGIFNMLISDYRISKDVKNHYLKV